ncbi:serine/threonine-protein kinase [Arthrobacter sp. TMN-37]
MDASSTGGHGFHPGDADGDAAQNGDVADGDSDRDTDHGGDTGGTGTGSAAAGFPPSVEGFRTGRLLGTGGSSAVWLVTAADGAIFALKVGSGEGAGPLPEGGDPGAAPEGTALREVLVAGGLRHEHLVAVHGIVPTSRGAGVLMDYAPGGSLSNLVGVRGPLPVGEAVTVLVPVAQALAHLHRHGVLHGDVTPSNILFTEEGKPLLSDFGLGWRLGEGRRPSGGTPGFTDPCLPDPEHLNTEADIFSLGAVAWFALTGRVPGPSTQRPPLSVLVPEVPPGFVDLIEEALSEDPAQRPDADTFARVTLRAGTAVPVELVDAVEEDVRPRLVTRRDASPPAGTGLLGKIGAGIAAGKGRRPPAGRQAGRPKGKGPGLRTQRRPGKGKDLPATPIRSGRRADRRSTARRGPRWVLAAGLAVLAAAAVWGGAAGQPGPVVGHPEDAVTQGHLDAPGSGDGAGERPGPGTEPNPREGPVPREAAEARANPKRPGTVGPSDLPEPPGGRTPPDAPRALDAAEPQGSAARGSETATDPVSALPQLAQQRAAAFAAADPTLLEAVNVAGSPAMAEDVGRVTTLADSGRRLAGLRLTVLAAKPLESPVGDPGGTDERGGAGRDPHSAEAGGGGAGGTDAPGGAGAPDGPDAAGGAGGAGGADAPGGAPRTAAVAATVEVSAYTELDSSGAAVSAEVPPHRQELVFVLQDEGGWKISSVYEGVPAR